MPYCLTIKNSIQNPKDLKLVVEFRTPSFIDSGILSCGSLHILAHVIIIAVTSHVPLSCCASKTSFSQCCEPYLFFVLITLMVPLQQRSEDPWCLVREIYMNEPQSLGLPKTFISFMLKSLSGLHVDCHLLIGEVTLMNSEKCFELWV